MKIHFATHDRMTPPPCRGLIDAGAKAGASVSPRPCGQARRRLIAKNPALRALVLGLLRNALKLDTTIRFGIPWYRDARELARPDWDRRIAEATDPTWRYRAGFACRCTAFWGAMI